MVSKITYLAPLVHYLTVNGKYLTPNNSVFPSKTITGPLTSDTITDWRATPEIRELSINMTIQKGFGLLSINLLVLDPIESSNGISSSGNPPIANISIVPKSSAVSGNAVVRMTVSRSGDATAWVNSTPRLLGSFPVPFKWQLQFIIIGSFSIVGTFEGRD